MNNKALFKEIRQALDADCRNPVEKIYSDKRKGGTRHKIVFTYGHKLALTAFGALVRTLNRNKIKNARVYWFKSTNQQNVISYWTLCFVIPNKRLAKRSK